MSGDWKEVTIGDITTSCLGKMLDKQKNKGEYQPYLANVNVRWGGFDLSDLPQMRFEDSEQERYGLKYGDIVLCEGGEPGRCAIWKNQIPNMKIQKALHRIRVNEGVSNEYLYYWFLWAGKCGLLNSYFTGTTIQHLPGEKLKSIRLRIPPYEYQLKVAPVLSCLDAKIELNNQINENLQQQAQAIFKAWFVDYEPFGGVMPAEWREGILADIADITMGQSPDGSSYNEEGEGVVFFQGRAEFGFRFPSIRLFTTEPKRFACKNDVLMSVRAPVGDLNIAHEDCCIGRGLSAIHAKDGMQSFILYTMFAMQKALDVFNGEGTVFGSINQKALKNMPVIIPSDDVIAEFERLVEPMDKIVEVNCDEIIHLYILKDVLLSKLFSNSLM